MKGMKKILSSLLAALLLFSCIGYAEKVTEEDYEWGEVLFSYDFEADAAGSVPSAVGNIYLTGTPEWTTVKAETGSCVVENEYGNKFYQFYNNGNSDSSEQLAKSFNVSQQMEEAFCVEFDLRTMGTPFLVRFYDMVGSQTTDLLNLGRNATSVYRQTIQPTQWNHYSIICDSKHNRMLVMVNDRLAADTVFQAKASPNKTTCTLSFTAVASLRDEAYLDHVKVTKLKPVFSPDKDDSEITDHWETIDFRSSENGIPEFGATEEILGQASFAVKSTRAATGKTELGYRTYITFVGVPAYVYEFDALTGEYINRFPCGSGQNYAFQVGSNGKLYNIPQGGPTLYEYDPLTREKRTVMSDYADGKFGPNWAMNLGDDGNRDMLYTAHFMNDFSERGSVPVSEYNVKTGEMKVYENVSVVNKYMHAATGNDQYIFASSGDDAGTEMLIRFDKKTGERLEWKNDGRVTSGNVGQCILIGDRLFTRIRQYSIVLDTNTMQEVSRFESGTRGGKQSVSYRKPDGDPDIVYYMAPNESALMEYNLKTGETKQNVLFDNALEGLGVQNFGTWVQKADGTWAISAVKGHETIGLITPGDPHIEFHPLVIPSTIQGTPTHLQHLYVSRDDVLYAGGYEAGLNGFDLKTNQSLFSVSNEIQHAMTMVAGKLFCMTYSNGNVYLYDPEKPADLKNGNPKYLAKAPVVCRGYSSCDTTAGFGVIAGVADYGGKEGSVILCTYQDGKPMVKSYNGVIPEENIAGVAYRDGYLYAGSTVTVNMHERHPEAHVAKIDAKTGETVLLKSYQIDGLGAIERIGEIAFGPDGLLYCAANNQTTLMALDPDTLELVKYKTYYPLRDEGSGVWPPRLFFGADGVLYSTLGNQIHAINIETMEAKVLWPTSQACITLDNDGNILKRAGRNSAGNELSSLKVNQRQRLDIMIQNAEKYYKAEEYSQKTWDAFAKALKEAKRIDLRKSSDAEVKTAARKLTFAIKDLQRKYDEAAGFAYPFGITSFFKDMTAGYSESQITAVNTLKELGVISGTDGENYEPQRAVTRAEWVKMQILLQGENPEHTENTEIPFRDVLQTNWAFPYIQKGYQLGWIAGISKQNLHRMRS